MPSIRKFSQLHEVSVTTAINCYHRMQELGWLQAKPQSGYYVTQPFGKQNTPEFPKFKSKITQPKLTTANTFSRLSPFYSAQLAPELIPQNVLNQCFRRAAIKYQKTIHLYPDFQGQKSFRQILAQHFTTQYFPLEANSLVITNGCIDAIRTAIEVTTVEGDAIAITSPCFSGLLELLANMKRKVVEIPCHQGCLDLLQLEEHLAKKEIAACLFSANHINPQGICLSSKQKQHIAELAKQYNVPVIEDDVYLELSHSNLTPLPIKYWDKEGWVLWCSSISKTITPSYRLGWCEPGRYFAQYLNYRSVQSSGVNSPVQNAIHEFIYSGQYLKHLKQLRLKLAQHMLSYHALLKKHLPSNTRISHSQGGSVIWIQMPNLNAQQLLEKTKQQGTYFRCGNEFSSLNLYQDCFRINIGWPINAGSAEESIENSHRKQLIDLCELTHSFI